MVGSRKRMIMLGKFSDRQKLSDYPCWMNSVKHVELTYGTIPRKGRSLAGQNVGLSVFSEQV